MPKPGLCPRCGDSNTEKVADSPVKGVWEVFGCNHCNYLWRSTEKITIPKIPAKKLQEAIWLWNDKGQASLRSRDQL